MKRDLKQYAELQKKIEGRHNREYWKTIRENDPIKYKEGLQKQKQERLSYLTKQACLPLSLFWLVRRKNIWFWWVIVYWRRRVKKVQPVWSYLLLLYIDDPSVTEAVKQGKYYELAHKNQEVIDRQPALLQGGILKPYQMEGLRWLVSLYSFLVNLHW